MKSGVAVALASASAIFFGFSNICFKLGVSSLGEIGAGKLGSVHLIRGLLTSRWIIAGLCLTGASGMFYIAAISRAEVLRVVAVLSLSYLVTAILARLFLGEPLTAYKVGGMCMIVLGIIVVHSR